jgi:hypothetical protein
VSDAASTYDATVQAPPGYRVVVEPTSLTLGPGESASFEVRIRNRAAPSGEWRFGSLTWTDGTHVVRSPIAVNGDVIAATEQVSGEGTEGTAPIDVTFGFAGTYTAGAHGLVEPLLTLVPVAEDEFDSFDFSQEADEPLVYLAEAPEGAVALRFAIFDAYSDSEEHDLDLYVYYCPDFVCTLVGAPFLFGSNEEVRVPLPVNDPAIDDPYAVFVHGYDTAGGAGANTLFFDWTVEGPTGNLTVDPETVEATIGSSATVNANWTGLMEGAGFKYYGAVSHSDPNEIKTITQVDVDNDGDGGYCDIVDCGP